MNQNCRFQMIKDGKTAIPRSCQVCGLFGRCQNGLSNPYATHSETSSPGASPAEYGLIEKALRVMGAKTSSLTVLVDLQRTVGMVNPELPDEEDKALFIHECRLYLREKGFNELRIRYYPSGFVLFDAVSHFDWCWSAHRESISSPALQTEHEAYAQAVLAASGQAIGQAETQEDKVNG